LPNAAKKQWATFVSAVLFQECNSNRATTWLLRLSGKRGFIETFSAELHRGQGTFHLVVDKVAVAKETFMENGWEAAEENVPAQTLANKPGKAGSRRFLKVVR